LLQSGKKQKCDALFLIIRCEKYLTDEGKTVFISTLSTYFFSYVLMISRKIMGFRLIAAIHHSAIFYMALRTPKKLDN